MLDPNKIQSINLNRAQMIMKGFIDNDIEKGKKMPIGTISHGHEKVAEGKWVPVKEGNKSSKQSLQDATDHVIENKDGSFDIDVLDPDSQEKKFKEGDVVHYKDDKGNEHVGMVGKDKGDGIHAIRKKKESTTKNKVKQKKKSFSAMSEKELTAAYKKQFAGDPSYFNREEKVAILQAGSLKNWSKEEKEVIEHFVEYGVEMSKNFSLSSAAKAVDLSKEDTMTVLANLEDEEVMQEIADGDYDNFDSILTPSVLSRLGVESNDGEEASYEEAEEKLEDLRDSDDFQQFVLGRYEEDFIDAGEDEDDAYDLAIDRVLDELQEDFTKYDKYL